MEEQKLSKEEKDKKQFRQIVIGCIIGAIIGILLILANDYLKSHPETYTIYEQGYIVIQQPLQPY